jgi:hypothetical protein
MNYDLCVVSTISSGLGVIGQAHNLSWISGTKTDTWVDVDCPDVALNECVAFGSGLRMISILLNTIDHTKSDVGAMVEYRTLDGDFISSSRGYSGTSIIHLAPSAGRQIEYVWEHSFNSGFVITSNGNVISYEPYQIEIENTMLTTAILIAVSVSVPGVILGLIYMNSPFLQRKYNQFVRKKKK